MSPPFFTFSKPDENQAISLIERNVLSSTARRVHATWTGKENLNVRRQFLPERKDQRTEDNLTEDN